MKGSLRQLAVLIAALAVLAACGDANPLADTQWRLIELGEEGSPDTVVVGNLDVQFSETEIGGWSGCNAYAAKYTVRGDKLRLTELGWTEAGCPSEALFRQEQRIEDSLIAMERFEVSGNRLTLQSKGGQVLILEITGVRLE